MENEGKGVEKGGRGVEKEERGVEKGERGEVKEERGERNERHKFRVLQCCGGKENHSIPRGWSNG